MATNNKPVDVSFAGTNIVLPEINGKPMSYDDAIKAIKRKKDEEEQEVNIHHNIPCSPLDGAVAFMRALVETFGWTNGVTVETFFGKRNLTTLVGVPTGPNGEIEQVPYGAVEVPGIEGRFHTSFAWEPPAFNVGGTIKKKHEPQVEQIIKRTRELLTERSIYKNQAVKVSFAWQREDKDWDPFEHAPKFMPLNPGMETNLIFGDEVARQLEIALFTPIEFKEACRRYQIPLKRGILLYGPYGTGKTLTASITALKAIRNNWTFVYLDDVRDLKQGLDFAARYAPAVLFSEDIDRVVTGERSSRMDEILNTLDGVDTKNGEIITVFTTNHVENINPALLRMGRLDALVQIQPPDAKAAARLVMLYARGLLEANANLDIISQKLAGKIPAFIREVTERAKIAAISRLGGGELEGHVTERDLIDAAIQMEAHNDFLKPRPKPMEVGRPQVIVNLSDQHPAAAQALNSLTEQRIDA